MKIRMAALATAFCALLLIVSCVAEKTNGAPDGGEVSQEHGGGSPAPGGSSAGEGEPSSAYPAASFKPEVEVRVEEPIVRNESARTLKQEEIRLPAKKPKEYVQGLLQTRLKTKSGKEGVRLKFSLTNLSGRELKLTFGSGLRYDYVVVNSRDEEIYRWSEDKVFTQAQIESKLKRDESLEFEEMWSLVDRDGAPVPDGDYVVRLHIPVRVELPDGQAADPEQLKAEAALSVKKEQS
ncbi:BsuPI-related putative proteinase inhibitor [Cohnella hongkongensis]|uniref:Intracellular proteinase inhibitor BsuPI domain-containing protein n=1 Tax=Cohnella hongkongensis TaxID=178337 RepID=A0ABV9F6M3_9BACL